MNEEDIGNEKLEDFAECSSATCEDVLNAVNQKDWTRLRSLSLGPGGFDEARRHAWPFLMHAEQEAGFTKVEDETDSLGPPMRRRRRRTSTPLALKKEEDGSETFGDEPSASRAEPHPDERQIKLDTDRSFVLYSVDDHRDVGLLQSELNDLITSVFRRHPQLSYFQGYHDIVTVLFLTLPESDQLPCVEKMSLHRLRDAMGKGLEPLLGLLHILKYLLRLADSDYAALLERNTPLPYYALSNLLTLFSHDVPTLPLIQHVFDFLLCRPPIAVVYLAAAIILARKDDAFEMERDGEEGMLHSLLSSLPGLSDGEELIETEKPEYDGNNILGEDFINPDSTEKEVIPESVQVVIPATEPEATCSETPETKDAELLDYHADSGSSTDQLDAVYPTSGIDPVESQGMEGSESFARFRADAEVTIQIQMDDSRSVTVPGSSIVSDLSSSDLVSSESPEKETPSRPVSPHTDASSDHPPRKMMSLLALLKHADTLFEQFPPSHPGLHVSTIMGPQSVVFTWSEDPHSLLSDEEAEALMEHPELIVLPFVDPDEVTKESEGDLSGVGRVRRKLRKRMRRKHYGVRLDKKTVLTGTVVALSVAVAVYSMRTKGNGGVLDVSRSDKTLRKTARVVSGILIGGSERILETFGW